jgi:hypothetical protein
MRSRRKAVGDEQQLGGHQHSVRMSQENLIISVSLFAARRPGGRLLLASGGLSDDLNATDVQKIISIGILPDFPMLLNWHRLETTDGTRPS